MRRLQGELALVPCWLLAAASDPVSAGTSVGSANGMYVRTITHKY